MGSAMVPKADSHVAVVTKTAVPAGEDDDVYLPPPTREDAEHRDREGKLYTEIVVRDGSQVLPLGYVVVKWRKSERLRKKRRSSARSNGGEGGVGNIDSGGSSGEGGGRGRH